MKIKFNTDDNLPLNKPLKLHLLTILLGAFLMKIVNFTRNFIQMTVCISNMSKNTSRKQLINARIRQNWYFQRN